MWTFARKQMGLGQPAAALAALTWAFSGFFAWRGAGGHSTFLAFHYVPWIFLCWRRAHDDPRYAAGVAALVGLVLFEGGTYPFPLTFLLLAVDAVAFLVDQPRKVWRVLRTGLVSGALTLLVGAGRLWPIYLTMNRFPRATELDDTQRLADVLESLTAREPHAWVWGHRWVWAEYGSYVGWAMVALAGYGLFLAASRRRLAPLVVGLFTMTWCAMGGTEPLWPWPLLHELPVYSNLHVPSRFHVMVTFHLALIAAFALDRGFRWMRSSATGRGPQRALNALAWTLVLAVGLDVVSNDIRVASRWDGGPVEVEPEPRFHLVGSAHYLERYATYPSRHVGTPECYDPVPWPISRALWLGDRPQVRFEPADAGELVAFERTNHRARAQVRLRRPARMLVNQNFERDWRSSVGATADSRGLLAVDLPAGEHSVVLAYEPRDLPWSMLTTALGLVLCALLAMRGLRWRRAV
jgi:hypothetical protein